ncbi:MAG: CobW family GTP-binding protein [Rubrivivax sp.]
MQPAIPVTLIGGYLGAGKTTLVNHLLRERGERRIAVLVNDFGELSIDDALIESRDGPLLRLAGGCVCCSFGSDLMAALQQMLALQPRPEHILIETSGVALPGAVARLLGLLPGLQLEAVLVLADAQTLRERAADRFVGELVRQQLQDADLVLLNKTDLVPRAAVDALHTWLGAAAPRARMLPCMHAQVSPELLLGGAVARAHGPRSRPADVPLTLPLVGDASTLFESLSLEFGHAVDASALAAALVAPAMRLLRAKGLMRDRDGTPCSLQLVGARTSLAASAHPRAQAGRLVCIALRGDLDADRIRAALNACAD